MRHGDNKENDLLIKEEDMSGSKNFMRNLQRFRKKEGFYPSLLQKVYKVQWTGQDHERFLYIDKSQAIACLAQRVDKP